MPAFARLGREHRTALFVSALGGVGHGRRTSPSLPGGPMGEVTKIGATEIRYEEDMGFVHLILGGRADEEQATAIVDTLSRYADLGSSDSVLFILCNMRNAQPSTTKARHVFATRYPRCAMYVAVYGASLVLRATYKLLVTSFSLTSSRKFFTDAVANEADARAWLTEQRRAYLARTALSEISRPGAPSSS